MSTSPSANMKKSLHPFSSSPLTLLAPQVSRVHPKSETPGGSPSEPVSNRRVALRSSRQPRLSYSSFARDHPTNLNATEEYPPQREEEEEDEEEEDRTWNLRPRKACVGGGSKKKNQKPVTTEPAPKSNRQRQLEAKNENQRLWVSLSREEIEEDLFRMSGNKPSRRPRKRAKRLQKHLDVMSPGRGLAGMIASEYPLLRLSDDGGL